MKYVVAFYEIALGVGRPEEGGWYYDTGTLDRLYRTYANENGAWRAAQALSQGTPKLLLRPTRPETCAQKRAATGLWPGGKGGRNE